MSHIGVNVILTGGQRRQWNFKFCLASEHWMQMGEGARLPVAHQKEMHQFAMVGDERCPAAATFRGVHVDCQNGLVVFGAHLGRHRKRLVEGIVPVVAVFEVPPFLSAKSQERKNDRGQRHGRATPPPVFSCRKRSRIKTALPENRSGNLQPAEEQDRSQRRQYNDMGAGHGACIGCHRVHRDHQSAFAA